eukprot:CAMPEP_0197275694 /NCGR_PEP_ID=MMETSP1432-20130617/14244_1 /TAXON_ID=44447 /ORGANISM="Pseudo-nitzschia delicatissima, Strain UNC1205" /LENGTH=215 /DNA_ID=CAMNT_0042741623 /DNA_START=63 /DNA_END=710 /DNA_ORIENTATION=-
MVLFVEGFGDRVKADKLSEVSAGWIGWMIGGDNTENLAKESVWHESLENARASPGHSIGKESFAIAMNLAQTLGHATLPASESDTTGRIIVFSDDESNTGLPSVQACVDALGLKRTIGGIDLLAESSVTPKDWSSYSSYGFCYEEEDEIVEEDAEGEDGIDYRKILAATRLMESELTDHFEYNVSEKIVCAPVLYGGRHNNSNAIVAVLSMRVWT